MLFRTISLVLLSITLTACNITGSAQKGPFKQGSPVSASQLNSQGLPISSATINTQVFSSQGRFSVDRIEWSGWTGLTATGAYFNELSNSDSNTVLTLNAITRKDKRFDTANITLFTHIAAARIKQRISNGQNRNNAWRDTQSEMIQVFGLTRVSRNFHRGVEQLSLVSGSGSYRNDNANLLLFTGAFLASGGDETSLLALTDDFADDGQFNGLGQATFAAIARAGNTDGLITILAQNLSSNGAFNPPNQQDLQQLPVWVDTESGNTDTVIPVITIGNAEVSLEQGTAFEDDVSAEDNVDGDITEKVVITGTVDVETIGLYTLTYNVSDAAGNAAETVTRTVEITELPDTTAPVISIENAEVSLDQGQTFLEDVTASDDRDGDLTENVVINGSVDIETAGVYTLTYNVSDLAGNAAETVTRTVTINDITPPVISVGSIEVSLDQGEEFVEDVSALDNLDGDLSSDVVVTGSVDTDTAGTYTLTYDVSDAANNAAATVTRTVTINDITPPVISIGSIEVSLDQGEVFVEDVSALDNLDGDLSSEVVVTGSVDTANAGTYTLTYNVSDAANNAAITVTRTVIINDITPPVIVIGSSDISLEQGSVFVEDVTASDDTDGDISGNVVTTGSVDTETVGTYSIAYDVADAAGNNATTVTRNVEVTAIPLEFSIINLRITDPTGELLSNASITAFASDQTSTDFGSGKGDLVKLELIADAEYTLKIDIDGYATQVLQAKSPLEGEVINLDVTMIARGEVQTFIAEDGGTITGNNGASVVIQANSFETASGGEVSGQIQVTITPVDVSNSSTLAAFPGEFIGIQTDSSETPIISYGTVEYEFTRNGEKLQLIEGATADILIPIYISTYQDGSSITEGDSIPLWSLNENTGIWLQEGVGIVVPSADSPTGLALQATVSHFTWWNCDVSMNAGQANVSVTTNDPLFSGTALLIATVDQSCNIGWRPNTVSRLVTVGGNVSNLIIPSSCEVCWRAELTQTNSQLISSNYQCDTASPNGIVNIDLNLAEIGPLEIVANQQEIHNVSSVLGFVPDRVQIRPSTLEVAVNYSIVNGSLPPGMSLLQKNLTQAEIIGFPSAAGSFSVEIQGIDDTGTEIDTVTVNYSVVDPTDVDAPLFINDEIYLPIFGFGFEGPIGPPLGEPCIGDDDLLCPVDVNDPLNPAPLYDLNAYNVGGESSSWSLEIDNDQNFPTAPPNWFQLTSEGLLELGPDPIPSYSQWRGIVRATNSAGTATTKIRICTGDCSSEPTPIPGDYALSVSNAFNSEGVNNTLIFRVRLNQLSTEAIVVNYTTVDDTAIAGEDYVAATSSVIIPAGEIEADIIIDIIDDSVLDSLFQEVMYLDISSPTARIIEGLGRGRGSIRDNESINVD